MKYIFCCAAILIVFTASAQEKMETDRPSETISAKVLKKKIFHSEFGFQFEKKDDLKSMLQPNAVLRFGLIDKLEIRLETNLETQKQASHKVTGFRPLEFGAKGEILQTANEHFALSAVAHLGIPVLSSDDFRPDKVYYRTRLLFENKLSDKFHLNYNVGREWDNEDDQQKWMYSLSPEWEVGKHWNIFIEEYSFFDKGSKPEHVADAGLAYTIKDKTRLDLSTGIGLNNVSPDYIVALGISLQLNNGR